MMDTNEPQDPHGPEGADSPGDIPAVRPASLDRLDVLTGGTRVLAALHRRDFRRRYRDQGRVGGVAGRAGVEA